MKINFKHTLIICLLIIFGTNKSLAQTDNQNLKRVWMLVEFQKFKKTDCITLKAQMDLTNLETPTAQMGCNNIGFKIEVKKNKLKFSKIRRTLIYCENKMQVEESFVKELPSYKTYKIEAHKLIIKNSKNQKMIFIVRDWD